MSQENQENCSTKSETVRAKGSARNLEGVCSEYEEAAIYLQEGTKNGKLYHHPSNLYSYRAYKIIHHPCYSALEFTVSTLLLLLAFLEEPTFLSVPMWVAPLLEIALLLIPASDVVLKLFWIKPKFLLKHKRTLLKILLLTVMSIEAIVVLGRAEPHIRFTRAFRPLFLLDNNISVGVRRVLRQIIKNVGPITDVLILLFFFITIFATSGYYLFATTSSTNFQFKTFRESFISLYITVTTANFPDVMMEAYANHPIYAPLFFVIFLILCLYIISNVLLAVVYSTFQRTQKQKFKNLYLHRRNALRHAFQVLEIRGYIQFMSFLKLMKSYSPYTSQLRSTLTFKALKSDETSYMDHLKIDEFYSFYDLENLEWSRLTGYGEKFRWYLWITWLPDTMTSYLRVLTKIVEHLAFKVVMNLIVLANALFFFIITSHSDVEHRFAKSNSALTINFVFLALYVVEIILKIIGLGPVYYFKGYWNIFDFTVVIASWIFQLIELQQEGFAFLIPLRFLRLIRFNKRLRAIFNTLAIIFNRILSMMVLLVLIYYFFAIIGMECFHGRVVEGCCNESISVGKFYTGNGSNVYYLNNFNSISQSYVTLFELMVINNWWILMEGFLAATNDPNSRAFFICFHLTTTVVLTVALAFIVEAFVLKIQLVHQEYKNRAGAVDSEGQDMEEYTVSVNDSEIKIMEEEFTMPYWPWELTKASRTGVVGVLELTFRGFKPKTKADVHRQLYAEELKTWISEDEKAYQSVLYAYNQLPSEPAIKWIPAIKQKIYQLLMYIFE